MFLIARVPCPEMEIVGLGGEYEGSLPVVSAKSGSRFIGRQLEKRCEVGSPEGRMMFVLALDQGTTSSRTLLFDERGRVGALCPKRVFSILSSVRMGRA